MHWLSQDKTVSAENPYRKAKIEHYMERAEELVRMARYNAAKKTLAIISTLDPHYRPAEKLRQDIETELLRLLRNSTSSDYVPESKERTQRRHEIVLVVDLDERILITMVSTLHKYGFGAIGAASFEEAVEALAAFKPHLIISEVNFENGPVGYDLYLWVRHNDELKDIPFLYLATRVTREMLIAGKRMGVDEFIVKPLDEEVVMASILNCLSRQRKKKVA
ncbi:MAG TPA: response regulator [Bacteroidota bacterium]|nr:response regulator [Bacteroidota bacterium]